MAELEGWTFLTNHGHVLVCLSRDPALRVRDVAAQVGITERATLRILHDLVASGYAVRERDGRRTRYRFVLDRPMRHPVEGDRTVGDLLTALAAVPRKRGTAGVARTNGRDGGPADASPSRP